MSINSVKALCVEICKALNILKPIFTKNVFLRWKGQIDLPKTPKTVQTEIKHPCKV